MLDTDGEPMRAGLRAEPAVVAPNVAEAEEAVGHEFNDADDLVLGLAGLIEMGAGEAIITREAAASRSSASGVERRRYEVEIEPLEPVADGRLGRRLPGRLRRRALRGRARRASASPTASPAAPSRRSTSAPARSTRARSSGSLPRVEVRELEASAARLLAPRGGAPRSAG